MKSTPSKIFLGLIITAAILCLIYFSRQTTETIKKAYQALISAVQNGQISKERIDESVYRILKLKESKDL
ncbi:MAG: hypothetical protein WCG02_04195 [Candidatus Taylorbacteria bacterium]